MSLPSVQMSSYQPHNISKMETLRKSLSPQKGDKRTEASKSPVKRKDPLPLGVGDGKVVPIKKKLTPKAKKPKATLEDIPDIMKKYPILKNEQLIQQFMQVPMNNNQKGRIRQAVKESLHGTSNELVPHIIHGKIRDILNSSENLTDAQLRRIRILYNLLKTSLKEQNGLEDKTKEKKLKKKEPSKLTTDESEKDGKKNLKKKKLKRYVVFLGNLPLDVNKEKIMNHFSEMNEQIKDIRIPKIKDGKKSAIAYVELTNEPSYEFALSKHHSMLGKRRISVLYTTQVNGKITKADAKSKSAKLIALQKAGKLVGSVPLVKKRSQRRVRLKLAMAKDADV